MALDLIFQTEAANMLGLDKRTLQKRQTIAPIGHIRIHDRIFPVYDRAGIETVTKEAQEQKSDE